MLRFGSVVTILLLAACGGGGGGGDDGTPDARRDGGTTPDASPAPYCTPKAGSALRLQLITDAVENPVAVAAPHGDPRLFIVEQPGRIRIVKDGLLLSTPFLTIDTNDLGDEQGLLGLAFHPDYEKNGRFFVHYIRPGSNDIRIAEYTATGDVASPTEKVILDVPHPSADNHNGGTLVFGTDGYLYVSLGDGGAADNFYEHGQNPDSHKAKVLRLDVDSGDPYGIPASNPWAGGGGVPEMYAWGLRNPWKIAIDAANGDLWIGDVGQGWYEEVDVVRAGGAGPNFGWAVFEGPDCFTADPDGNAGCSDPDAYRFPVMYYDRRGTGQCSVIVGGVYRGTCMPDLVGQVFFGDYCSGEVRTFPATSTSLDYGATTDRTSDLDPQGVLFGRLSGFGVDGYNELYVTALQSGEVYRIEVE
jgi:glucose/arabinose dehydrogenase